MLGPPPSPRSPSLSEQKMGTLFSCFQSKENPPDLFFWCCPKLPRRRPPETRLGQGCLSQLRPRRPQRLLGAFLLFSFLRPSQDPTAAFTSKEPLFLLIYERVVLLSTSRVPPHLLFYRILAPRPLFLGENGVEPRATPSRFDFARFSTP